MLFDAATQIILSTLRHRIVTAVLVAVAAGCSSSEPGSPVREPVSVVSAQPAMQALVSLQADGPSTKALGENLLDLSGTWLNWSGSGSTVRFDPAIGALLIPASQPGLDMVLGVRRYDQSLTAGRSYTLTVQADNPAAAAMLFLFDAAGQIVPVPGTPDGQLRFARTDEPLSFTAPGDVAGFFLQVQNQWQAPSPTTLSATMATDQDNGDGPNLITPVDDWRDWFGSPSGIVAQGTGLVIPPPTGNIRIGVHRFATALVAGARYELSLEAASDDQAAALVFLIDSSGQIVDFADAATGIRSPWLAATRNIRKQFLAPEGIAGFAIQAQSGWQASATATIIPSLRLAGGEPPCVIPVEQPSISFGPAIGGGIFDIDLTGDGLTECLP